MFLINKNTDEIISVIFKFKGIKEEDKSLALQILNQEKYEDKISGLKKESDKGNALASHLLGIIYENDGLKKTHNCTKNIMTLFNNSANQNFAPAQYHLAAIYEERNSSTIYAAKQLGLKHDDDTVFGLYKKASEQSFAPADARLALANLRGELGLRKNYSKALKLCKKAAENDYAPAQYYLAESYRYGKFGLKQDSNQAINLLKKAADQGYSAAMERLAGIYNYGKWGQERDLEKAFDLYSKLAEKDHKSSITRRNELLFDGKFNKKLMEKHEAGDAKGEYKIQIFKVKKTEELIKESLLCYELEDINENLRTMSKDKIIDSEFTEEATALNGLEKRITYNDDLFEAMIKVAKTNHNIDQTQEISKDETKYLPIGVILSTRRGLLELMDSIKQENEKDKKPAAKTTENSWAASERKRRAEEQSNLGKRKRQL